MFKLKTSRFSAVNWKRKYITALRKRGFNHSKITDQTVIYAYMEELNS